MNDKKCPICRKHNLFYWESVCWWCWQYLAWHDQEFGTNWCKNLILFNTFREECRECGFDPIEGIPS